jgi:hypothetical protein
MEELIQKLQSEHGLSAEQSQGILNTITNFVKEKFPMVGGAIDNIFKSSTSSSGSGEAAANTRSAGNSGSFLDKIADFIPGDKGEKIEEFAKEKLGGFFGGTKSA